MAQARLTIAFLLALFGPVSVSGADARLDAATADRFARLALACIDREWPNKPEHVLDGAEDARPPRAFHPAFFGCYDWHSSVHGHWMVLRLLRAFPNLPSASEIRGRLEAHFSAEAMATETRYLDRASARSFERPYGWAWLLRLATELDGWDDPQAKGWRERIRPLEDAVVRRLSDYLPKLTNPVRTGVHPNTAFALGEAIDYARRAGRKELEAILISRSRTYFGRDRDCPLSYEPSGEDFFSPCLEEADLMRRVLPSREFAVWLDGFLPSLRAREGLGLTPAVVADPTDPKLVHLDGLNLTRAWTMRGIAASLPNTDPRRTRLLSSSDSHAKAGLARVSSGNYEGEHWLASFAVYLLTDTEARRYPRADSAAGVVSYPFSIEGRTFVPAALPIVSANSTAAVAVFAFNFGESNADALQVSPQVLSRGGEPVRAQVRIERRPEEGPSGARKVALALKSEGLEPGLYTLRVRVSDRVSRRSAESSAPFEVR